MVFQEMSTKSLSCWLRSGLGLLVDPYVWSIVCLNPHRSTKHWAFFCVWMGAWTSNLFWTARCLPWVAPSHVFQRIWLLLISALLGGWWHWRSFFYIYSEHFFSDKEIPLLKDAWDLPQAISLSLRWRLWFPGKTLETWVRDKGFYYSWHR